MNSVRLCRGIPERRGASGAAVIVSAVLAVSRVVAAQGPSPAVSLRARFKTL